MFVRIKDSMRPYCLPALPDGLKLPTSLGHQLDPLSAYTGETNVPCDQRPRFFWIEYERLGVQPPITTRYDLSAKDAS